MGSQVSIDLSPIERVLERLNQAVVALSRPTYTAGVFPNLQDTYVSPPRVVLMTVHNPDPAVSILIQLAEGRSSTPIFAKTLAPGDTYTNLNLKFEEGIYIQSFANSPVATPSLGFLALGYLLEHFE